MKKFIKMILFVFIFYIIWNKVFSVLWLKKTAIYSFYNEPKNSLDVVYLGSSSVGSHFNSVLAYNEYGFTTGMLSSGGQPFTAVEYLIRDSQKYQNPNLYIIDIAASIGGFAYNPESQDEWCRSVFDHMPFSLNRIDTINYMLNYAKIPNEAYINYYFSYLMYHTSWKNIDSSFFEEPSFKGSWYYNEFDFQRRYVDYVWTKEKLPLDEENIVVLNNLINYIKTNDLNVLFVIPNRAFSSYECSLFNTVVDIIENNGYKVLNFNVEKDLKLNALTDFYDDYHLNIFGSIKFTLYFSNYLKDNYELKDHRGDGLYQSWDKSYQDFIGFFKEIYAYRFPRIIS